MKFNFQCLSNLTCPKGHSYVNTNSIYQHILLDTHCELPTYWQITGITLSIFSQIFGHNVKFIFNSSKNMECSTTIFLFNSCYMKLWVLSSFILLFYPILFSISLRSNDISLYLSTGFTNQQQYSLFATKIFNVHAKGSNFFEVHQILLGKKVMVGIVKCDDK